MKSKCNSRAIQFLQNLGTYERCEELKKYLIYLQSLKEDAEIFLSNSTLEMHITKCEQQLTDTIATITYTFEKLLDVLPTLTPRELYFLRHRYIENKSIEEIASDLHYCERSIFNIQRSLLSKIEQHLNKDLGSNA